MSKRPTPETDKNALLLANLDDWIDDCLRNSKPIGLTLCDARKRISDQSDRIAELWDAMEIIRRERDEAREELSSIHRWVERHNQDGFDDKLTHRQNVDICYDLLYDRLDMAELELNRIKRAVIATLDENRHLADGMDCTLIKLRAVVPTWE